MKRVLAIATAVIVIVGLGIATYFYFFADSSGVAVAPGGYTLPTAGQSAQFAEGDSDSSSSAGTPSPVSARLVRISAGPVVPGELVTDRKAADASSTPETAVWYIERQSGNVFTYFARAKTLARTNNKTVPGIQSADWLPDASFAFVRYLSGDDFSTINTYALAATSSDGFFISQNLSDIAVSATNILTLASGVNGSVASLMRTDGTRSSELFTTPLSSVRVSFAGKNQYLVYTKPSATLDGDAFLVDGSGKFSRVAGPLSGLAALASPSGKWVFVSFVNGATMLSKLVNTLTGESLALPIATIADKCVWTNDDSSLYCGVPVNPPLASYPDDWYQGAVQFSDRIWRIDVSNRYAQLVLDFNKETGGELDAEALAVNPSKTDIVFVNKNDGSLWTYSL